MTHKFTCGNCQKELELPNNQGANAKVEMACWYCDALNIVNRYKMTVVETHPPQPA